MELNSFLVIVVIILFVVTFVYAVPNIQRLAKPRTQFTDPSLEIKVKLHEGGVMPVRAHGDDACFDLFLPKRTKLELGRQQIPLGFSMQIPEGYCAYIRSRSGNMSKGLENVLGERFEAEVKTGIVDAGYRGIVGCIIDNKVLPHEGLKTELSTTLAAGYKIGQMAILPVPKVTLLEVDSLDDSERGEGGFGSTGTT